MTEPKKDENWERNALEKLAFSALQEQRRARQWGILFKCLTLGYLFILLFIFMGWFSGDEDHSNGEHTALVDMQGVIAPQADASADMVIRGLRNAFEDENTKGVVLRINSPGGSPVQAGQINDEINRLKNEYPDIPFYVVVSDICASGGYYVAVAADKIFVDKASLVGSIGVLMNGFGFTETMDKLGIERRLITAGSNKDFLDPFSPEDPQQVEYAKNMIQDVHQQFIDVVRDGRGERLSDDPQLFSGLIWHGEKSIALGLADDYGTIYSVARDVIGAEDIIDFTAQEALPERLMKQLGAGAAQALGVQQWTGLR